MINAKKNLGQNFLIDQNKINKIISSIPNLNEFTVIEVGPGKGALTTKLVAKALKVIAIEIDLDMINILNQNITNDNFKLIHQNVLEINWNNFLKNETKVQFISNLPYYISTKILFDAIEYNNFEYISVMLQKELVDRIFAKLNSRMYGRLTVAINTFYELTKKIDVSANCFNPKPNVDSSFIVLKRKNIDLDIKDFLNFIKHSFALKRKTFLNSLLISNFKKVDQVKKYLRDNEINLLVRAEEISVSEFIEIYKNLN